MTQHLLSVREIQKPDIELIANYWLTAAPEFLLGMGVDLDKVPAKEKWLEMLNEQLSQSYAEKQSYCIIWTVDHEPIGHSNVNKIKFGEDAYMHLHIWRNDVRRKGNGVQFVKLSLPHFFENLKLKRICCEPYALNPAPNRVLEQVGFSLVKEYKTIPGWINFEQSVKHWELTLEEYQRLKK